MIAHGPGFIIRHRSGRYLSSRWVPPIVHPGGGLESNFTYSLVDDRLAADMVRVRQFCGTFLTRAPEWARVVDQFEVVPRPGCGCCGSQYCRQTGPSIFRCDRHADRNACAIDGCTRTTSANGRPADDQWFCAEHWRALVPPRSRVRRAYHRLFRLAKRQGWTPELNARFDRFWRALVKRARRGAAGDLDMAEIEKLFGWAA